MSTRVVVKLEKSPLKEAEELYRLIRQNNFISSNSLFVDTENFKKGKDNHLLCVDHKIIGVIRDHKPLGFFVDFFSCFLGDYFTDFFSNLCSRFFNCFSKRPVVGIVYLNEDRPWKFKVFGEENFKEMTELGNKISKHFDVTIDLVMSPSRPFLEEDINEIWRSSSYVGRC